MTVNHIPISSISNRTNNFGGDKKAGLAPSATGQILKNSTWNYALGLNGRANGKIINDNKYIISIHNQVSSIGVMVPLSQKGVSNNDVINKANRALAGIKPANGRALNLTIRGGKHGFLGTGI